jgi:hypothetical protein
MALWDASISWVTMVVRASSAEEAREIAVARVRSMKLEKAVGEPEVSADWPLRLDPEGPTEILVESSN